MRTFCTLLFSFSLMLCLHAQSSGSAKDTLLQHTFEGILDPADTMLNQPTGYDAQWVNFDQDNKVGLCVSNGPTPKGWYWESDLGFVDPNSADNYAFTSCSFLQSAFPQNRNWLITSPIHIPDNTYRLSWRSLSYYGPDFMDGYHVLASTDSNMPVDFTDTLFSAAQTVERLQVGSLDLNDYVFSSGYIQANGYTLEDFFFVDFEGPDPFYHGKLEPHNVDLSAYAGQTIYLAFLHDSYDDFQVQVDDILVSNNLVSTVSPLEFPHFNISPNPVSEVARFSWKALHAREGNLSILDHSGKLIFEKKLAPQTEGELRLDLRQLGPGVYYCKLETALGLATRKLIKL